MQIAFRIKGAREFSAEDTEVQIVNREDGRIIGRIFTPSGTGEIHQDAIQVCGFSNAFEHWGCGTIGDNDGKPLQDIQLMFKDFKAGEGNDMNGLAFTVGNIPILNKKGCERCFHWKNNVGNCRCDELKVFRRFEDIEKWEKRHKLYLDKTKIIKELSDEKPSWER